MLILMRQFSALDPTASSFMKNHPSGIERYNYLQGEAVRCTSLQSRQRDPAATTPVTTPSSASSPVSNPSDAEAVWQLVQNPNSRWAFKIGGGFLYGAHALPEERKRLGDFDTVDAKKEGSGYIGTQRVRITFRIKDGSPQGSHYKACQWSYAVELRYVTEDRIEGRWEGYPPNSQLDPLTCERSGARVWEDVAWVRE
jgi:hypothetical protein